MLIVDVNVVSSVCGRSRALPLARAWGTGDRRMNVVRTPVAKNVYCYMDIKIGPRFAGRMVFEVSRKV